MIESFESTRRLKFSRSRTSAAATLQLQQNSLQNPRRNFAIGVDSPISQTFSCRRSGKKPHATPPGAHNHRLWAACRLLAPVCHQNSTSIQVQLTRGVTFQAAVADAAAGSCKQSRHRTLLSQATAAAGLQPAPQKLQKLQKLQGRDLDRVILYLPVSEFQQFTKQDQEAGLIASFLQFSDTAAIFQQNCKKIQCLGLFCVVDSEHSLNSV